MKQTTVVKQIGFTLIELLVVIAISAIVMTVATPSFNRFIHKSEVQKAANGLQSALRIALEKSRLSGRSVTVCPTSALNTATPSCLNAQDFRTAFEDNETLTDIGWIVFRDIDGDNIVDQASSTASGSTATGTGSSTTVGRNSPGDTVYKRLPITQQFVDMRWSNGDPIISIAPRSTTGNNGTMCIYAPNGSFTAPASSVCNSEAELDNNVYEAKIIISTLGKITYLH